MNQMENKTFLTTLSSLLENTNDDIAVLANSTAFLYEQYADINWVGFYLLKNDALVLGPFQGRPACVHIALGKGACGTCATNKQVVILPDVTKVENYISCHTETKSEIVLPLIIDNVLIGVLDIDSLSLDRFKQNDKLLLEQVVNIITQNLK